MSLDGFGKFWRAYIRCYRGHEENMIVNASKINGAMCETFLYLRLSSVFVLVL
jgi:hypothetical protein